MANRVRLAQCKVPIPPPKPCQYAAMFSTSAPAGKPQVEGINAPYVYSSGDIHADGNLIVGGKIIGGGSSSGTFGLDNGTSTAPSLYFTAENDLGMYRPAAGTIAFTDGGVPIAAGTTTTFQVNNQLSTAGGNDLSILPGGPNVDFNGRNLINVGAIIANPNYFQIVSAAPVTTPNATPTPVVSFATAIDTAYAVRAEITGISLVDATSTASISLFAKGKNIGGVVSVTAATLTTVITDAPLDGVSAQLTVSGINIDVAVIGLGGINIKWSAGGYVSAVSFA